MCEGPKNKLHAMVSIHSEDSTGRRNRTHGNCKAGILRLIQRYPMIKGSLVNWPEKEANIKRTKIYMLTKSERAFLGSVAPHKTLQKSLQNVRMKIYCILFVLDFGIFVHRSNGQLKWTAYWDMWENDIQLEKMKVGSFRRA